MKAPSERMHFATCTLCSPINILSNCTETSMSLPHSGLVRKTVKPPLGDKRRTSSHLTCNLVSLVCFMGIILLLFHFYHLSSLVFCALCFTHTVTPTNLKDDTLLHSLSFQTTPAYGKLSQRTPPSLFLQKTITAC